MKATYHIGIDPDVKLSGVCVWNSQTRTIERLECLGFFDLFRRLESKAMEKGFDRKCTRIVIDAGWLNKTNFHARANENHKVNSIIGERTGANHETGKKIVEMCEYLGLACELHRPTNSKIKSDYFARLTGWKGRTNQEMRDAAMLVFGV